MDKKTKTIALIIATVLVWGYSALEWIDYIGASDEEYSTQVSSYIPQVTPLKLKPKKENKLQLNYRDPFLNSKKQRKTSNHTASFTPTNNRGTATNRQPTKQVETKVIQWPEINYSGVINNQLGLLKVNGKDYLVKVGDIKDGLTINEIHPDKIVISYQTEQKEFEKKS